MVAAVRFIHAQKIVHFDLNKPGNFVRNPNGSHRISLVLLQVEELFSTFKMQFVKLSDFGLARVLEPNKTHISRHGHCGTVLYMAPEAFHQGEQYESSMKMRPETDIWSLGIILYAMIYGKPPHAHLYTHRG
ncbi:unnamed protein product, partial [Amoebophrya sp. A120]|eukprot:GSA120T00026100001.1